MQRLFDFFYRYRVFTLFLIMELFSLWLITRFNTFQGSAFFNSSNAFTGSVLQVSDDISYYFNLKSVNLQVAEENRMLREQLQRMQQNKIILDERKSDTSRIYQYRYITARVINSSTNKLSNYFTIDKGSADGVQPGMGVLSINGSVAGKIKACSDNFSTAVSLLHDRWSLSSKIKRGNIDGIVEWKGGEPTEADLLHVGKHHKVYVGDTIVTSGYNSIIFPAGIMIGTIKSIVDDGKKYIIKVRLSTDYTAMSYVYVINNNLKPELDSLETKTTSLQD